MKARHSDEDYVPPHHGDSVNPEEFPGLAATRWEAQHPAGLLNGPARPAKRGVKCPVTPRINRKTILLPVYVMLNNRTCTLSAQYLKTPK